MKPTLTKQVLFQFFDGKATAIQKTSINAWLTDQANQELYYQYLDEWESQRPQFTLDADAAFTKLQTNLQSVSPASSIITADRPDLVKAGPVHGAFRWRVWAMAASILLVLGLGTYGLRTQLRYASYQTAYGQTATYRLADGTRVTLNANSTLRVPRFGFGSDTREVLLEGEGEFSVSHTVDNRRFVVRTDDDFRVEVLGTEFVVYARQRGKRIFLNKGKVKLALPQGQQLYMNPGNVVTVTNSGRYRLTKSAPARPYLAWKEHWFYFDNTSLAEVAEQIQERFGVRIVVADAALANRRIAGNFKAEKADDLLQILTEMLNLTAVKTRRHIELRTSQQSS